MPSDWVKPKYFITDLSNAVQLLKAYQIKFQKFAAHAHKDALINGTFIPT